MLWYIEFLWCTVRTVIQEEENNMLKKAVYKLQHYVKVHKERKEQLNTVVGRRSAEER